MCYNIIATKYKHRGFWAMTTLSQLAQKRNELAKMLSCFCKEFGVFKLLARFGAQKARGIPFRDVFGFILSLVFSGRNLFNTKVSEFGRDTVYRFLNNAKIHWERIVLLLATSVITRVRALTDENRLTAIVIDDSPYSRNRSRKVELLTKVYDHVTHKFFMGFRMLTMGFTDGATFIPFAKQLMSSVKATVPAKTSDGRTLAARRRRNAVKEMPARIYELLRMAKAVRIPAKHVLFDSWFSNPVTMMTIKKIGFYCVAMLKKNETGYLFRGEKKTLSQIHRSVRKRPGRSKYLASVSILLTHKDFTDPVPATVVFVRDRKNSKKWCALISTDASLTPEQIIELYGKRWDIEVFFKMCKSYLKLAKEFEGRSYDMMTAHTSIVFIRYICLAWEQRQNRDPRCFGELFYFLTDEIEDISFRQALETLLSVMLEALHDALFLTESQITYLLDNFFAKLPPFYQNLLVPTGRVARRLATSSPHRTNPAKSGIPKFTANPLCLAHPP